MKGKNIKAFLKMNKNAKNNNYIFIYVKAHIKYQVKAY